VAVNPSPKISMSRSQSAHVVALERIHPSLSVLYSPADWESIIQYNVLCNDLIRLLSS
jgi:hypothetical protein